MREDVQRAAWEPVEFPQLCRFLAECSPQPMVAVEGATHIVRYANPAFRRLLGRREEQLIGRPFAEAVPEGMANGCGALLARVLATGMPEALAEQPHGAPPTHWSYLAWAILGPDGAREPKPVGVMIQVTDTTAIATFRRDAVAINAALLESGLRLHELTERAAQLNADLRRSDALEREARLEAEAANRSKEIFLATLSHELRTPLNAILGWAVMLRMGDKDGIVEAELDDGLAVIERNARAQAALIEDVLDVARVASGKFKLDCRACDLAAVVRAAVDSMRPAATAKNIALEVTAEPGALTVLADPARLHQAVLNLLNNALKFTPAGGTVWVRLERDTGVARLVVADTGQGIEPEFLPFVFDRFKQADEGNARVYGGLGLGLAIVRHIADLHGGSVTASSEGANRGATFTLELPLPATHAVPSASGGKGDCAARSATAGPPVELHDLRVLVVDDDEDARTVLRRVLESAGATVTAAGSAAEAFDLAACTSPPPDVLVSDIAMPVEDGYSLIHRVRAAGSGARALPAVAVTALASPEDQRRALRAGFQVHLQKPVDPRELILTVGRLTGRGNAPADTRRDA